MESEKVDSVLRTTEIKRNLVGEMSVEDRKKKTEEGYGSKEIEMKKSYDAISKNGDTLELSEDGKKMREHSDMNSQSLSSLSAKKIISESAKQVSDNILKGYSEAKLKQLYANNEITKQQYDRIIKKKKSDS